MLSRLSDRGPVIPHNYIECGYCGTWCHPATVEEHMDEMCGPLVCAGCGKRMHPTWREPKVRIPGGSSPDGWYECPRCGEVVNESGGDSTAAGLVSPYDPAADFSPLEIEMVRQAMEAKK